MKLENNILTNRSIRNARKRKTTKRKAKRNKHKSKFVHRISRNVTPDKKPNRKMQGNNKPMGVKEGNK